VIRTRVLKNLLFCALCLGILHPDASAQIPGMAPPSTAQSAPPLGNNSAPAREAIGWLVDLIKINTTNPPGNEEAAAKYIAAILQKERITAELLPLVPGRSALVARLKSSAFSDPSKALLLVAHMDVVGVERAKWTVDPFGAVPKDGYIYGRGAIDDKGMLAANLAAFVALKRSNARLNRDVIFLATTGEESGGDASIRMLISKYWDKIAAKYAINEGGNVFVKSGKVQYVAVQASEKVPVNVTVTAKGTSGHASIPLKDNAVTHLSEALEKIGNYNAPVHFTTIVRRYLKASRRCRTTKSRNGFARWTLQTVASTRRV
jgi:acetylornithine deacetylase/succinyl-diaminopimelate desuccinylase-like protein